MANQNSNKKRSSRRNVKSTPKARNSEQSIRQTHNDPSWYALNEFLLKDSSSHAFSWPLGGKIDLNDPDKDVDQFTIPGICALHVAHTIGPAVDANSAINIAARNIYSYVRHVNSGHTNYDAPDLMLYLLSMDSIYSLIGYMIRAYGLVNLYAQKNRYYPKRLLEASRINYDDFINHIADFRYFINQCVQKVGSLCVPNSMALNARHVWLYSNVYVDDPTTKAQSYIFVPDVLYEFTVEEGPGFLKPIKLIDEMADETKGFSFKELQTLVNRLIDSVMSQEDMNIMSGDILKAFGDNNLIKLPGVAEDYLVLPAYEPVVLSQIQNATLCGKVDFTHIPIDMWRIKQNVAIGTGWLQHHPAFVYEQGKHSYRGDRLATINVEDPTPAEVMEMTRWCVIKRELTNVGQELRVIEPDYWGSDVITTADLYYMDGSIQMDNDTLNIEQNADNTDYNKDRIAAVLALSKFKFHPAVFVYWTDKNDIMSYIETIFDVDNYTVFSSMDLKKMHETAMLSMLEVPLMGAFSNKTGQGTK